jgi:NRPS condensation-like uncharacterized protein
MRTRCASALDLFTDSIRLLGDATLCAAIEFDLRLDPTALGAAATACVRAHPILHSRLVRGYGPARWELAEPEGDLRVQAEDCPSDYHRYVPRPVDPRGPLQIHVRLLRRPSSDVVVVNLAHAAADAYGLHVLMADLLREYIAPGSLGYAEGGLPERDTLWTCRFAAEEPKPWQRLQVVNPMWPDPFGTAKGPASFHRERLSPPVLTAVRHHVRELGGTFNDAILAAYYLTMTDLTGHCDPIAVFFPVNLRQHLNDGSRVMSNQAANVSIPLERPFGEGADEVLARVIDGTRRLKSDRIGIAEQVEMDALCDTEGRRVQEMAEEMMAQQELGLADIFISNPGPFALPEMEGLVDAYVCYPGVKMPATCFITSSFRGWMTVTMGYQEDDRARARTRTAMNLFCQHLCRFALLD